MGGSVALATTAIIASDEAKTPEEFADYGEAALISTAAGGIIGAAVGYHNATALCFVAGTLVQTEDGEKPIEEIAVGDHVWAWAEETGEIALKPVIKTYENETDELIHVYVNGEEIVSTPGHPFYSPVRGWTDAIHLRAGDILVLVNGEYVIVEKVQHELLEASINVYNFNVDGFHTYYVSDSGVLVHNQCSMELSDDALRGFGEQGNNKGFRVASGSHDEAINFVQQQTNGLVEYAPNKFVGYNSRGVEFRVYAREGYSYTSIRINGVSGLKGIKFLW